MPLDSDQEGDEEQENVVRRTRVTMIGRVTGRRNIIHPLNLNSVTISGSNHFDQYETEGVARRPISIVEELEACKEQLELAREQLKLANELIKGIWIQYTTIFFLYFCFRCGSPEGRK